MGKIKKSHTKTAQLFIFFALSNCMFCVADLHAQSVTKKGLPFITNYTTESSTNLSGQVWSIAQDDRGLIYAGQPSGLLVYDGVNWKPVNEDKEKPFSVIRAMAKDKHGRIFCGGIGNFGYVARDSAGNDYLCSLLKFIPDSVKNFLDIFSISIDGNSIYFQSRERLFRFTENMQGKNEGWTVKTWEPKTKFMYGFFPGDKYYVHQSELGLFSIQGDSLAFIHGSEFLGKERMQVMLPYSLPGDKNKTKPDRFLIGMFYSGLFLYDGKTFTPFKTEADPILKASKLYKALLLKDGTYAMATTGNGLVIIDANGRLLQSIDIKEGLQDASVYYLYTDKDENIWLALNNGISKIQISSPFTVYNNQSGISAAPLSIAKFEGELYVGTATHLLRLNQASNHFEIVPNIPSSQVFKMTEAENQLYLSTDGLYTIKNKNAYAVQHSVGGSMQLVSAFFSKRYKAFFCGSAFGLFAFSKKNPIPNTATSQNSAFALKGPIPGIYEAVYSIVEDKEGLLWAGTQNGITYSILPFTDPDGNIDLKKTKITKYTVDNTSANSGILFKAKDDVFLTGDSLLLRFDKARQHFIKDSSFFTNNNADYIALADNTGKVWIYFDKKMHSYTPVPGGTYKVDSTSFLYLGNDIANIYTDSSGIVWFAATNQVIRYDPNIPSNYDRPYKALIRGVSANKKALNLNSQIDKTGPVRIAYKDNNLHFDYAALFYEKENKTLYQTWLEGFEKDWSDWGKNTYREFTNLANGSYTFHVRAKNTYGNISEEASYSFSVQAPWYNTWWAWFVYILLFSLIIWSIIKYRSRLLKKENRVLEEKITLRTAQLNNTIKELKSTQTQLIQSEKMASLGELTAGIAHEIQNPLNFVNNFSEVNKELIAEMKEEIAKGNYEEVHALAKDIEDNEEKIIHHGKRADAIVKGMLQHSRSSSGQKEPTDINALCDEYLRLSYHGLRAKDKSMNATLTTDFDNSIGKINVVPQDIGRVVLNLLTNAFYAVNEKKQLLANSHELIANSYEPTVSISTKKINNKIEIKVADNGNGIPQKVLDKIFQPFFTTKPAGQGTGLGLSLSYDIITKGHGGELKVETKEEEGTIFIIELPIK